MEHEKVYIILRLYLPTRGVVERAMIYSMALSPGKFEEKLIFGMAGKDDQYSFGQLRDVLSEITIEKGDVLPLSVINPETGDKKNINLDSSKGWPYRQDVGIETRIEITSALKNIGIL